MEHTDTNLGRTSQEKHHVIARKPNRLMLSGETVAVYCENHTEHTDTYKLSSYLTGNTLRLHYTAWPVIVVCGKQSLFTVRTTTSPLQSPTGECCLGKQSLLTARTIWKTDILCGQNAGL
jgi:hypothetical protein